MLLISAASYTLDGLCASYGNDSPLNWQLIDCRRENISTNWTEIWQTEVSRMNTISSLSNSARLMALEPHFSPCAVHFNTDKHLLQFVKFSLLTTLPLFISCPTASSHALCLGTSSVTKRYLHNYQNLHCEYSATAVTQSVLELAQLADMFRFIVVLS